MSLAEDMSPNLPALAMLLDVNRTPEEVALDCLVQHRIAQQALPVMVARVMACPELHQAVMEQVIAAHCRRLLEASVSQRHQEEKRRTGGGPLGAGSPRSADMSAWATQVRGALLDGFILPGGKRLGDATRQDIGHAMATYQTMSADAAIKERWMRLIQQSIRGEDTVRQSITEERLEELRAEARKVDQ